MNWFHRIFRRDKIAAELAEEMRLHLEERIEVFEREGMSREDAEYAARRAFGNTTVIAERSRETWQWPRIESLWADAKYALRQLRKSPAFAVTTILTLALGIGMNTSIFTVFQQVLLRTMPVHRPEELVLLQEHSRAESGTISSNGGNLSLYFSFPAYEAMSANTVTSGMAVSALAPVTLSSHAATDRTYTQFVSGSYFDVLGLQPVIGRLLNAADNRVHAGNPVTVVSEAYWRAHMGADPSLLNTTVRMNGIPLTVVGIVRHQGLMDASPVEFFAPVAMQQAIVPGHGETMTDPLNAWLSIIARLAPGVSRAQAETQLNTLWWNWRRDTLNVHKDNIFDKARFLQTHLTVAKGARGIALYEDAFGGPITILQVMAFVVLLIVCGNIANLLLARAVQRHAEIAMRAALGASHRRILQQVFVEGLMLGVIGAMCGLLIGRLTLRALLHITPEGDNLHSLLSSKLDWRMICFSMAAGVLTSIVFSLAPAILSARINLLRSLHGQSGSVTPNAGGVRSLLVVTQIALSIGLMASATVFACNLYYLRTIHPGFATDRVVTFRMDATQQGKNAVLADQEYRTMAESIRRVPGVTGVVYAQNGLITGNTAGDSVSVPGHVNTPDDPTPDHDAVSPGFFSSMEIPLLAGREFTETDAASGAKVALVDEAFVKYYLRGDMHQAIGSMFRFGTGAPDTTIIGIIPTIHSRELAKDPGTPLVYLPWHVTPGEKNPPHQLPVSFYVRTTSDPAALMGSVRTLVHSIDSSLPIDGFETMQQHIGDLMFSERLVTMLSVAMGALALMLAAIGLYGVLAFSVTQRTREIGIRMALGADRRDVSALVCRQVAKLVFAGTILGTLFAWGAVRVLISRDKDLAHVPWWLFGLTGAVMPLAIATATLLPARRAAWIDPMRALRTE